MNKMLVEDHPVETIEDIVAGESLAIAKEFEVISASFQDGFSIKDPAGTVRRFACCQFHDSDSYAVVMKEGRFFLVHKDGRDQAFAELEREELPPETRATFGYHDSEHGEWEQLPTLLAARAAH